jgi:hypothetical protein
MRKVTDNLDLGRVLCFPGHLAVPGIGHRAGLAIYWLIFVVFSCNVT